MGMTAPTILTLAQLYRYPVKGLSPEPVTVADLAPGAYFPGDRLFAIENGPSGFDPAAPRHQPKIKYLMLMRDEALARLSTRYDDATRVLAIEGGGAPMQADLGSAEGRRAVAAFFQGFMGAGLRGAPVPLAAPPGYRFTDSPIGYVSLIGRASVTAVEDFVGATVDPLRFRANLYFDGLLPFAELELVGRELAGPGGLRLRVTKRTQRCAATNVDPATGARDLDIPAALRRHLGHTDLGVYAEVLAGGRLAPGDALTPA